MINLLKRCLAYKLKIVRYRRVFLNEFFFTGLHYIFTCLMLLIGQTITIAHLKTNYRKRDQNLR